ncbi:contact-dependent growth inhibition system immunity protein [Cupriavidus oxalaticus]|uniref:contact-dependent growth inhibition system immunity protein n=1 Tax=Cupriavidus oxalaticus TaxID=96344 RepID=UPI003F739372
MTAIFPTVKNMFSAYLNQDFELMFGTAEDAIRAFLDHTSHENVWRASEEVRAILAMKLREDELQKLILGDLGCCYYYPAQWSSADFWLRHVLELLDSYGCE